MTATDRTSRRRRKGSGRVAGALLQSPWSQPRHTDRPVDPIGAEGAARIHGAAMHILEEIGIEFLNEDALAILRRSRGCRVEGENVRMDRDFVMEKVALAPEHFTVTPRDPTRRITIGDNMLAFGNVSSPPNCSDLDRGRRPGDRESYRDFLKMSQHFNCIHFIGGYPVEPVDLHASIRHLDCLYDKLTLTDKVAHAYCLGPERVEDVLEMVRIAAGLDHDTFDQSPRLFTNINSSSPLKHDWPMLDGAMRFARRRQPVVVTPFTLAGAMAPLTLAGAVAQQTAECLAAIVLLQCITPGTPVVFGAFTSNVDMKSGAPAFGTPEYMRAMQMSGAMARFYGLPWRGSNACAANFPDAQAAWESAFSLWGVVTGGVNMVYHAAGWLEGGLCASYEKFIMDCDTLQQMAHYMKGVEISDDTLALDAIAEVGPRGHFFGCEHTQSRYQTAFYSPFISDWRNFENWEDGGAPKTHEHANRLWKQVLSEYEEPVLDDAIREELSGFVERRKREGGAPTDF